MALQELKEQILELSVNDRSALLQWLVESVESAIDPVSKRQWSSDFLSTFGAWEGEPLVRAPQGEGKGKERMALVEDFKQLFKETQALHADNNPLTDEEIALSLMGIMFF
jgi:hypothetical protein